MSERPLVMAAMLCVVVSTGPAVGFILDTFGPENFNAAFAAVFVTIFAVLVILVALAWRLGRLTDGIVPSQGVKAKIIGAIAVGCVAVYLFSLLSVGTFDAPLNVAFSLALGALFGATSVRAYAWLEVKGAGYALLPVLIGLIPALRTAWRCGSLWTFVTPFIASFFAAALVNWIALHRTANDGGASSR